MGSATVLSLFPRESRPPGESRRSTLHEKRLGQHSVGAGRQIALCHVVGCVACRDDDGTAAAAGFMSQQLTQLYPRSTSTATSDWNTHASPVT